MVHIGQPWTTDPRNLRLRPLSASAEDLSALAHVRNETLRAVQLPEDFNVWDAGQIQAFYCRGGFELEGNSWLISLADEPVAAAVVYPRSLFPERPPGNFDMYVVPQHRRHGLGTRLLAHLEQAAQARGHRVLETTIADEDASSSAFLQGHGFEVIGRSLRLTRYGLDDIEPAQLPDGYSIVPLAGVEDATSIYRETSNRLGAYDSNYSLIRPEDMQSLEQSGGWEPGGVMLLLDWQGRTVGIIRASGAGAERGYLHEIRIEPSLRGLGLGRALVASALQYLREGGVRLVELSTTGEQVAAYRLALGAGFRVTRHWLHHLKRL